MKLGIIAPPEAASIDHAKELGLDFVEFDCSSARRPLRKPVSVPAWKWALWAAGPATSWTKTAT